MKSFLFLDFDGVLFDTVQEAYYVACQTWGINTIDFNSKEYATFKDHRYLIAPAWNYFYIMEGLIENKPINRFEYNQACKKFEKKYFDTREALKKKDYDFWLSLNAPYKFLTMLVNIIEEINAEVYIVTAKDKPTVAHLLERYQINFIKDECILDKSLYEKFGGKRKIILNKLAPLDNLYKAVFIDDFDKHLLECEDIKNLDLIQANWGYVDKNNLTTYQMNELDAIKKIKDKFLV